MRERLGELRPSQFITTFGPGAIVDLPDLSVVIASLDRWDTRLCTPINEPRLKARLKLKKILSLPMAVDQRSDPGTLPVYRFPRFMVCPKCRRLDLHTSFSGNEKDHGLTCCHPYQPEDHRDPPARVFPVRFMVACARGHISDMPWYDYVHALRKGTRCTDSRLVLEDSGATGSISEVTVRCLSCDASRSLADAFSHDRRDALGSCEGRRPWVAPDDRESCGEPLRAMLRGASNAYFPIVLSALSIPPAVRPVHEVLPAIDEDLANGMPLEVLRQVIPYRPELAGFTAEEIIQAWQEQQGMAQNTGADLYLPEWQAMLNGSTADGAADFLTADQAVPSQFKGFIGRLVQVHRLREVRVLAGFTRIDPPPDPTMFFALEEDERSISQRVPLAKEPLGWLPGVVVHGEGIFVALDEAKVQQWENMKAVLEAGRVMEEEYHKFCEDRDLPEPAPFPGIRYVLLHSLAHALMRQLGLNSGYSSTALRERIYCRQPDEKGDEPMAGVLIYTATPDSEGSMGGLVEQGETEKFGRTLWRALQEASFCSGDPLCSEHKPQHTGELNGAACHACQMAAETSCERSNRFLDRSCLVPTVSLQELAFFKECL